MRCWRAWGALVKLTRGADSIGGGINAANDGGGRWTERVSSEYMHPIRFDKA